MQSVVRHDTDIGIVFALAPLCSRLFVSWYQACSETEANVKISLIPLSTVLNTIYIDLLLQGTTLLGIP